MPRALAFAAILLASTAPAFAQNSAPQPVPFANTIPDPQDVDYPGTIRLDIDATNTQQGIFAVKETVPVAQAGHMVLLFPKWLPGTHGPRGEIEKFAGLHIRANGKDVPWKRDPVDVYAFHVDVPEGAKQLDLTFQFISATVSDQGRIVMTPALMSLQWNSMSLYPAGYFTRRVPVVATVKYPENWSAASAVPATKEGSTYTYDKTTYDVLVDSPVLAGRWYKPIELSPRVTIDAFADTPAELAAKPEHIEALKGVVDQEVKLMGAQHYDHYHFLLSISDELGGAGLEHHRSSEDGVRTGFFTKWDENSGSRNVIPHEFTHSWDGKFRRGADLWTPDFRTPMRDSLLWVYEGQTQFWGYVIQARSGLVAKPETLDALAAIAASLDNRAARTWRPLVDTTNDPVITARRPKGWTSWQRSEDYYNEGLLIWLEVDSILRAKSNGTKSMDDFARAFFGINDGDWGEVTYTLDDVVKTLNDIVPNDWAGYLDERLNAVTDHAPLKGFTDNGYKLVYTEAPNKAGGGRAGASTDLSYSLGLTAGGGAPGAAAAAGKISSVMWDSPAFDAGLDLGDEITAINGMAFTGDRLKDAVTAAKTSGPIRLLVKSGDRYRDVAIDYHGGLRYPHLEKTGKGDTGLDKLLAPRVK